MYCFQSQDYKNIGKITAMSIVQGGSGMPIFHSSVYKYVCSGTCLGLVDDDDAVPDTQVRILLNEVGSVYHIMYLSHTHFLCLLLVFPYKYALILL